MGLQLVIYLLILHFVADFLFQSREMGQKKSSEFIWLAKHGLIHLGVFAFGVAIFFISSFWPILVEINPYLASVKIGNIVLTSCVFAITNMMLHMAVDACTWNAYKWTGARRNKDKSKEELKKDFKYWEDSWFYHTIGIDQLLHIIMMIFVYRTLVFPWHIG